ncbi:MAG: coenzyme F420-0:L-glutamate ligase [Candidatus Tectomicrobia bacterium]|uniref:Coenzyme F420-0:L-glutamate ligase n=1 Tax=Tectimicrobiota bacterium TaxID=2528274 RepID=A0A937VZE2_UNCTE|nr:coenzyme F420-0:L-glutamate ligase [Candidatus Tectomicrobia bacterium]
MNVHEVRVIGLPGIPIVTPGMHVASLIAQAAAAAAFPLQEGDIVVVTQKIVSKAEGWLIVLNTVTPSPFAARYAQQWDKDPRHVEVVLQQSRRIVKMDRGVLIAETHHGFICANAGVDQSNMEGEEVVAVLPPDPDASARTIRQGLRDHCGVDVAVIISDTFGRPWRDGLVNVAIGLAGMEAVKDYTGQLDAQGYELRVTSLAIADELASTAELVMNKLDNVPVAVIRGYDYPRGEGSLAQLVRAPERDLFR